MSFQDWVQIITSLFIVGNFISISYNTYQHKIMKTAIMEMQINMQREMSERYVSLPQFNEFKDSWFPRGRNMTK